jgi:hypothetical protein
MGERNFFPGQTTFEQEEEHRRESAAFQSKLCWLDTTSVLQDPQWQSFLQSLGSSLSSSLQTAALAAADVDAGGANGAPI